MKSIIDIARECGADDNFGNDVPECEPSWTLHESALTALESRIRADEREKAALKMAMAVDHLRFMAEGRGLIPGAAEGYKMALLVIEPMFREYVGDSDAAPVGETESMNSHLTDGDGSQVQAR